MPAHATITVNRETAPILLEMAQKTACGGAQAHLLGQLYAQIKRAHDAVVKPAKPKANET